MGTAASAAHRNSPARLAGPLCLPLPATASAEGAQLNAPPSLWEGLRPAPTQSRQRVGVRGFVAGVAPSPPPMVAHALQPLCRAEARPTRDIVDIVGRADARLFCA